jgi:hypothetical protein
MGEDDIAEMNEEARSGELEGDSAIPIELDSRPLGVPAELHDGRK